MAKTIRVARPSVASLLVIPEFDGTTLGSATGFVVEREGVAHLVTNFHVVSGRRPDDLRSVRADGAWPDRLQIFHNSTGGPGNWVVTKERLYREDDGLPCWLEHPVHRHRVDVVALPLTDTGDVAIYGYDPWAPKEVAVTMAGSLSIVGFPFGLSYGGAMPIWVQGFVATEPQIDCDNLPMFLIDSRTRQGQSGSPVIFYSAMGNYISERLGGGVMSAGEIEEFIGVYSGRVNEESDLGFVWKAEVVRDIIDDGVDGTVPGP